MDCEATGGDTACDVTTAGSRQPSFLALQCTTTHTSERVEELTAGTIHVCWVSLVLAPLIEDEHDVHCSSLITINLKPTVAAFTEAILVRVLQDAICDLAPWAVLARSCGWFEGEGERRGHVHQMVGKMKKMGATVRTIFTDDHNTPESGNVYQKLLKSAGNTRSVEEAW